MEGSICGRLFRVTVTARLLVVMQTSCGRTSVENFFNKLERLIGE